MSNLTKTVAVIEDRLNGIYPAIFINGTLDTEKITNGSFIANLDGWDGISWAQSGGKAVHTPGSIAALTQSGDAIAVVGETYKITYDLIRTAGSVQLYYGGVFGAIKYVNGTITEYITATAATGLSIIPTTDFAGSIDVVSVRKIITTQTTEIETPTDFRKVVTIFDRINFPDGHPISIGFNALPINSTGEYNTPSSNLAIGFYCGRLTTEGHITAVGYYAGEKNTTGVLTAFGRWAGRENTSGHATFFGNNAGGANTTGQSTAVGDECLSKNQTAHSTAVGYYAANKTVNKSITAMGYLAAANNVSGVGITALGDQALNNTTADGSTAVGHMAGSTNTTGVVTAVGYYAARLNTTGKPTAIGWNALLANTTGNSVAVGYNAGQANTSGLMVAVGYEAGYANTTSSSIMVGYNAGYSNTTGVLVAVGQSAGMYNTTGSLIAIGKYAGGVQGGNDPATDTFGILIGQSATRSVVTATVLTNYIGIGYGCLIDKSNQVKIGNAQITETVLFGTIHNASLATYADNATAVSGGLVAGNFYKTVTGELRIVV